MRELKFRQWTTGWASGTNRMIDLGDINDGEFHPLTIGVIMQYTEKKDVNNKDIYEGDILGCESNGVNRYEKRVVCWDSHQAKFKSVPLSTYHSNAGSGGWTGFDLYRTHCEVLGNIYENPELL